MLGGEAYRGSEREREREIKSPENRVQGAGFRVQGSRCRVQSAGRSHPVDLKPFATPEIRVVRDQTCGINVNFLS